MGNDYLLNITVIEAIGWLTIIKYVLVLIVEVVACIFLTSRIDKDRQRTLRLRVISLMLGLFVAGFFLQTPELYCLWFIVVVATTGVFANTKLGFGSDEVEAGSRIKVTPESRNMVAWLALALLAFTIGVGSNFIGTFSRGPEIGQDKVWSYRPERDGSIYLGFKEGDLAFYIHVSKEYATYFSEGDCLEITYYEFYPSLENFERYATKIQRSEGCK